MCMIIRVLYCAADAEVQYSTDDFWRMVASASSDREKSIQTKDLECRTCSMMLMRILQRFSVGPVGAQHDADITILVRYSQYSKVR